MDHNTEAPNERTELTRFARNRLREWLPESLDDSAAGTTLATITEAWIVDAGVFDDELPKNLGWCLHIAAEEEGIGLFEPDRRHEEHPLYRSLPKLTGVTAVARPRTGEHQTSDIETLAAQTRAPNGATAISWVADPAIIVKLENGKTTTRRLRAPILLAGDETAYIEDAQILTDPRYPPRTEAVTRALCGAYLVPTDEACERQRDRDDQTEIAMHRAVKLVATRQQADEWRIAERIKRHVRECIPQQSATTIRIGPNGSIKVSIEEP